MKIGKFTLVNEDKVHRAIFGTMSRGGVTVGGVGEAGTDDAKLAEYDRLGGLVRLGEDNVKRGCFWDFKSKKPHETPKVLLTFKINDKSVEVSADEPLPPLVRAAKTAQSEAEMAAELDSMSLSDLKEYAADANIDLGETKTKKAILAIIRGESEEG